MTYNSEYYKKWRLDNWEKRKAYSKEKVKCNVCNIYINRGSMYLHKKSKKHNDECNK